MYIPRQMKNKIASVFYDKTVSIMTREVTIDAEGGVSDKGLEVSSSFNGNVSFSNCKQIQEDYGLDYEIDIAISTDTDVSVAINDIISYESVIYKVTDILPFDSHKMVVAVKWHQ